MKEIKVISHLLLKILKKSTKEEQTLKVSFFVISERKDQSKFERCP